MMVEGRGRTIRGRKKAQILLGSSRLLFSRFFRGNKFGISLATFFETLWKVFTYLLVLLLLTHFVSFLRTHTKNMISTAFLLGLVLSTSVAAEGESDTLRRFSSFERLTHLQRAGPWVSRAP